MPDSFPYSYSSGYLVKGVISDSLGETPIESHWGYYQLMQTVKKGYYTDSENNQYVLLKDPMSDRLTGEAIVVTTKLKLRTKYKELGPYLGTLPQ